MIMEFVGFPDVAEPADPIVPEWVNGAYGQFPVSVQFPLFA